jgi:hypothetical protein
MFFFINSRASTSPWKASDGAVRKTRSLSFSVEIVGAVADEEIISTPAGIATVLATAMVTPEHIAPTIATTFSVLIRRSAALEAAVASVQVSSAWTNDSLPPLRMPPWALTWVATS